MTGLVALLLLHAPVSGRASTGAITGSAYQDLDRDAARDADEPVFEGHQLYLFTASGSYVATTITDVLGGYSFAGLASGGYRVEYASPSWWPIREEWVPTTTGSVYPHVAVQLAGSAVADFGWRRIVWSTDLSAPVSSYTGSSGLRVRSYTDAVAAADVHAAVAQGLVGAEGPTVEIRFGYGSVSITASAAVQDESGRYMSYSATSYASYLSWLDTGPQTVAHEYGHAWAGYYAHLVQQDPSLSGYLSARGLAGDPRIGSSYEWLPGELIAEDYRQLLGSPGARAGSQMNPEIPPAASVPGLSDYLQYTFTASPAPHPSPTPPPTSTGTPSPSTTPTPSPLIAVTGLTVTPAPVKNLATVAFTLSLPGSVTVTIRDAKGALVQTLANAKALSGGSTNLKWNRKNATGQRVKAGTYVVWVQAVDGSGASSIAQQSFGVA